MAMPRALPVACLLLLAAFAVAAAPPAPTMGAATTLDRDGDKVHDRLEVAFAERPGTVREVIVATTAVPSAARMGDLQAVAGEFSVLSNRDAVTGQGRPWYVLPGFAAALTERQARTLAAMDDVRYLQGAAQGSLLMDTAKDETGVTKARADFGVDGSRDGNSDAYSEDDVVICILDTGVDDGHVDLDGGQVIAWTDIRHGEPDPYDDNIPGHGTHVSGIAAGQGDGLSAFQGVAPGAALAVAKVALGGGTVGDLHIIDGLEWCVDGIEDFSADVVSVSLKGAGECTGDEGALADAANNAWEAGLVVVIAAGNEGPGECTVVLPGSASSVITVGSMSDPDNGNCGDDGGWYLARSSSRGLTSDGRVKPDLAAPGVCITAPLANSGTGYVAISGTSMATPFVAGVAALMLDADPTLTNDEVKAILHATAQDWGFDDQAGAPQSIDFGAGRLQAHRAVEDACDCGDYGDPANPAHFHAEEDLAGTGASDNWLLSVNDASRTVSVTLLVPDASPADKNFSLAVYRPNHLVMGTDGGGERQSLVSKSILLFGTGTYIVRVRSEAGAGAYGLDVSAGATAFAVSSDG